MRFVIPLMSLGLSSVACGGDKLELNLDMRTDYLPGRQFVGVQVELRSDDNTVLRSATVVATSGQDFLGGRRLADFDSLEPGTVRAEVTLLRPDGSTLVLHETLIELRESRAVTVPITSNCRVVSCPDSGDSSLNACVGGFCVDPRCTPETPEFCGTAGCIDDAQCDAESACTRGSCVTGICFVRSDDTLCEADQYCSIDDGCLLDPIATDSGAPDAGTPDTGTPDAGTPDTGTPDAGDCAETEIDCNDGMDDDCDDSVDCEDTDCFDVACDDSNLCTLDDRCTAEGECTGEALECADGNAC